MVKYTLGIASLVGVVGIDPDEPLLRPCKHAGLGVAALDIPPVAIDLALLLDVFDEIGPFLPLIDERLNFEFSSMKSGTSSPISPS